MEDKFKSGKRDGASETQEDLSLAFLGWISVLGIAFLLSVWIWMVILVFLSAYVGVFLQVFTDFYTKHILRELLIMVLIIVFGTFVYIVEIYRLVASERHKKCCEEIQKSYFLAFYITFLLLIFLFGFPFILEVSHILQVLQILRIQETNWFQIELRMIYVAIILIFFVLVLLKLCLKHSALDILFLIWSLLAVFATLFVVSYLRPELLIVIMILILLILLILLFIAKLLKLPVRKEISLNVPIKATKESVKEKNTFLKEIKKFDPLYDSECRLVNKIYLLAVFTLTLFTIGTIFIADFTRAGEYYNISQNIALCIYNISTYTQNITSDLLNISSRCTSYSNNISLICSLNHTIGIKSYLTIIRSEIENRSTFYHIDTFCAQYEQNKKDFITYFSTLIVATITFFVMMYEKFIRRKEKKRRHIKGK